MSSALRKELIALIQDEAKSQSNELSKDELEVAVEELFTDILGSLESIVHNAGTDFVC